MNEQLQGLLPGIGFAVGGSRVKTLFMSLVEVPFGTRAGACGVDFVDQLPEIVVLRAAVVFSPGVMSIDSISSQLELRLPAVELQRTAVS